MERGDLPSKNLSPEGLSCLWKIIRSSLKKIGELYEETSKGRDNDSLPVIADKLRRVTPSEALEEPLGLAW